MFRCNLFLKSFPKETCHWLRQSWFGVLLRLGADCIYRFDHFIRFGEKPNPQDLLLAPQWLLALK